MSKTKKQINQEIEKPTERVVGKFTPLEKKEIFKFAIDEGKDVEDVVREAVLNEINQKKS